jgi:fumarylacetoacetase
MPIELNATHDPKRRSWVESANAPETDFPIQNLPFGVFDDGKGARGGVALGDGIIDLSALLASGQVEGAAAVAGRGAGQVTRVAHPPEGRLARGPDV